MGPEPIVINSELWVAPSYTVENRRVSLRLIFHPEKNGVIGPPLLITILGAYLVGIVGGSSPDFFNSSKNFRGVPFPIWLVSLSKALLNSYFRGGGVFWGGWLISHNPNIYIQVWSFPTISYVKNLVHHPMETTIKNCLFGVTGMSYLKKKSLYQKSLFKTNLHHPLRCLLGVLHFW